MSAAETRTSIVAEALDLYNKGYREVTLLGQNVDSYKWNVDAKGNVKDADSPWCGLHS